MLYLILSLVIPQLTDDVFALLSFFYSFYPTLLLSVLCVSKSPCGLYMYLVSYLAPVFPLGINKVTLLYTPLIHLVFLSAPHPLCRCGASLRSAR